MDLITDRSYIVIDGGYPVEQSRWRGSRSRFGGVNEYFNDFVMRDDRIARRETTGQMDNPQARVIWYGVFVQSGDDNDQGFRLSGMN